MVVAIANHCSSFQLQAFEPDCHDQNPSPSVADEGSYQECTAGVELAHVFERASHTLWFPENFHGKIEGNAIFIKAIAY